MLGEFVGASPTRSTAAPVLHSHHGIAALASDHVAALVSQLLLALLLFSALIFHALGGRLKRQR